MGMKYSAISYEMPWRPNYELQIAVAWLIAGIISLSFIFVSSLPKSIFMLMSIVSITLSMTQLPQGLRLRKMQRSLLGRPLRFMTLSTLRSMIEEHPQEMWLGTGFEWENKHAQRTYEILKRDSSDISPDVLIPFYEKIPFYEDMKITLHQFMEKTQKFIAKKRGKPYVPKPYSKKSNDAPFGYSWIHGVEPDEHEMYQALTHTQGHTLIIGTTGAGKTRMFDMLISQAILRNEAVVIIDPKGDKDLPEHAKATCQYLGKENRFVYFNPAFPEKSTRLDMLRNFSRGTEVATRIAALIPTESGMDAFTAFGWKALNAIVQGLIVVEKRPTIRILKSYLELGGWSLLAKVIEKYSYEKLGKEEFYNKFEVFQSAKRLKEQASKKNASTSRAADLLEFFSEHVQPEFPNSDIEGLISSIRHDHTHFSKMVASLMPIMDMLTSGVLQDLLSPNTEDPYDTRPIMDMQKAIRDKRVVYVGLDSLTDGIVGSAIGSLLLSDLTSVAGARYNYGVDNEYVNVFVDEASEVLNDSFIQLLNKGRGSLIRLFVATQTIADFEARLGSAAKSLQVLGNINNTIALRLIDNNSQTYITDNLPSTRVRYVMRSQDQGSHADNPFHHSGSQGERLLEEESPLFQPQLLGSLPNLEFVAKISGGKLLKGRIPILTKG